MAYKTSRAPLSFVQSGILLSIFVIVLSAHLSLVNATKAGSTSTSVSFVTSSEDWSKDLDNIKPYGPSANHGALDPVTGYQAYRTFRFKLIRKLISVGPNLWNTICHYHTGSY